MGKMEQIKKRMIEQKKKEEKSFALIAAMEEIDDSQVLTPEDHGRRRSDINGRRDVCYHAHCQAINYSSASRE